MMKIVALASAMMMAARAQDQPAPSSLTGQWEGNGYAAFAAANPSNMNSLECMPAGNKISYKHKMNMTQYECGWGAVPASRMSQGASVWSYPAYPAKSYQWSMYSGNIGKLRVPGTEKLECYWMKTEGTGSSRKLYVVTLGGAGYQWTDQCSEAAYKAIKDVNKEPYCESQPGSRSPYKSTVLGIYDYKGGAIQGSGASSVSMALGAAATALFAVYRLF